MLFIHGETMLHPRLLCLPVICLSALPAAAAEPRLAAHRAVYELTLSNARETGGVRNVSGRIAMEAREKGCNNFELTYRQVMRMGSDEGTPNTIDFRSTTHESLDGRSFSFENKTLINGEEDSLVTGKGEKGEKEASIALKSPTSRTVNFGRTTVFPTQHLQLVLDAARKGKSTLQVPVYDGTDPGDVVTDTVAFIGDRREADARTDGLLDNAKLTDHRVWPVSIGYFEKAMLPSDQSPKFVYTAELMDNGITPNVKLDYGNFVVEGRLVELEVFPSASACR